ncbi:MAG: patatin-like phospholipase family protein, partial [Terracidiphilus sp.]
DSITAGLQHGFELRNALFSERGVNEFLETNLPAYDQEALDYDQLPIPFRCVATDLNTLTTVTFASGPLPHAVRASISIPGIFPPLQGRDGHYLVDGGILDNLPTDVLRNELHADTIIAVRLQDAALSPADTGSIVGVLNRAFSAGIVSNVDQSQKLADVVINVPVGSFSGTDYSKAAQLIDAGYAAANNSRDALLRFALDDAGWQAYISARNARLLPSPGILRTVRVAANNPPADPGAVREVERDMKPAESRPASSSAILDGLKGVQSNEVYSATYETIAQPASASNPGPDTGILIHLAKDPNGPPYLLVGPEGVASTSNVTQGEVALRFIDQNFGGYGSEFRAGARIGYMTGVSAEYYRLLSPNGFFIEPMASIVREPVYIWANQKRIAERFQQNLDAGLEAGRTFNNQLQVAAQWRAEDTRWSLRTGSDGGGYIAGTAQTGLLRFTLDRESSGTVSPNGFRISAAAGALYHAVASDNAPLVNLSFSRSQTWKQTNIFGFSGDVNSYLRARVADPFRFTLGGPMRLSASSIDEYRGTDTYLARSGYLHRIAALPTGLGQGLYAGVAYEAGEIWSPDQRAILRQDATTGVVAVTPLGVITIGVSVGDAGHRKVFLTIGRWF